MNFKKLLVAATMTVALASCNNGGGTTPSKNKLFSDIKDFLESREVVIEEMPYIDSIADSKVLHTESFEGDEEYIPYFYFVLEGDVLEPTFAALKAAEWTVPSEMSYYGYECFNKEETIEIDIFYSDEADEENGIYVGTNYYVYAYKDLVDDSEGEDEGDDYDWTEPDAAVALAIATNIYGAAAAEENVGWFFLYYVSNVVDGNDIQAAIPVAARYLPSGFNQVGEIATDTNTNEETGESYEYAYATFMNSDEIVVEIESALSNTAGKIDVFYLIYAAEDGEDLDPGTQEGDANVVQNPDGSYTATVDFSGFADQAVFEGQNVGDLSIGVIMDANKNNKPTYYTRGNSLRIYWGTGLSFSVPQGHELIKVEFTCTEGNSKTVDIDSSNLTVTGGTYTVNEKDVTINANQGVNNLSMVINLTGGNVAITGIAVTYK